MIVKVLVRFVLAFSYTTMNCDVHFHLRHLKCALMSEPMGKITVHHSCRRRFVDDRGGDKAYKPPRKSLRLSVDETAEKHYFDWKACCFICGKTADRRYSTVIPVRTIPLHDTLIKRCDERNDLWGEEVQSRLITCTDLVASFTIYHCVCMTKFRLAILSSSKAGCPINPVMMDNFERVCN